MKLSCFLALLFVPLLAACQPVISGDLVILDGTKQYDIPTESGMPSDLFVRAGLILGPYDIALFNGIPVPLNQALPPGANGTLQLRRAITLSVQTSRDTQTLQTTAPTIGQALQDAGFSLRPADRILPPASTPIESGMTVVYTSASSLVIQMKDASRQILSAAPTVGEALAESGIPMMGLDYSLPATDQPLPPDGQIRVVQVSEMVVLAQKPIAFENEFIASAEVPIDQQQVLNPGQTGLSVSRVRIRYVDGQEVSRQTESETLVRPPQNRVVGYGTKVEVKTASVDGVNIEYWRAVQMFATAYSPCRSGGDRCYSSTASGKPVKKGVVALRTDLYLGMRGQALYIPGYGYATVEDACGGCVGKPWVDLGYSDADYEPWGTWVTVYFLTPVPSGVYYNLE